MEGSPSRFLMAVEWKDPVQDLGVGAYIPEILTAEIASQQKLKRMQMNATECFSPF